LAQIQPDLPAMCSLAEVVCVATASVAPKPVTATIAPAIRALQFARPHVFHMAVNGENFPELRRQIREGNG
jgi:hypothetical protein